MTSYHYRSGKRWHVIYQRNRYLAALSRPHHMYGPSTLPYRARCAAWQPLPGATIAADYGTRQHELLLEADAWAKWDLIEEMDWAAKWAKTFVDRLKARFVNRIYRTRPQILKEHKVVVRKDDQELTWGYVDYVVLSASQQRAELVDYKFGWTEVDAPETNLQIWCYVVGLAQEFPKLEAVRAWIVQPRLGVETRPRATAATFLITGDNMREWTAVIENVINAAKELEDAPVDVWAAKATPNFHCCFYCNRLMQCPAAQQACRKMLDEIGCLKHVDAMQSVLDQLSGGNQDVAQDPAPKLRVIQAARRYINRIWAEVTDRVITAVKTTGKLPEQIKVVEQRQWQVINFRPLARLLKKKFSISEADLLKLCQPPPFSDVLDLLVARGLKDEELVVLLEDWKKKGLVSYTTKRPYVILTNPHHEPNKSNEPSEPN